MVLVVVVVGCLILRLVSVVTAVSDAAIATVSKFPSLPSLPVPRRAQVKGYNVSAKNNKKPTISPRLLIRAALNASLLRRFT